MVEEHAVLEREPALELEALGGMLGDDPQAELDVPEEAPLTAALDLRSVGELARLAEIVDDRRREQQVAVEAGVKYAQLEHEGRHGDGVLEQAAEVGMVGHPGAARRGGRRDRAG